MLTCVIRPWKYFDDFTKYQNTKNPYFSTYDYIKSQHYVLEGYKSWYNPNIINKKVSQSYN